MIPRFNLSSSFLDGAGEYWGVWTSLSSSIPAAIGLRAVTEVEQTCLAP